MLSRNPIALMPPSSAACPIYGRWRQSSDVVEAGCGLWLPGQWMTAAWPLHQPHNNRYLGHLAVGSPHRRIKAFPYRAVHPRGRLVPGDLPRNLQTIR